MILVPDPNWKEIISIRLASVQYRLNYVGGLRCVVASEIRSRGGRRLGHQVCLGPKAICLLIRSQEPRGQGKSQVQGLGFQFDFESQQNRKLLTAEKPGNRDHWIYYFKQRKAKCNNCLLLPPLGSEVEVSGRKNPQNRLIEKGTEGLGLGSRGGCMLPASCSFNFSFQEYKNQSPWVK